MTVNELLRTAKSLMERQGHCKHRYIEPSGALCPSGALMAAQLKGGEPVKYKELSQAIACLNGELFNIDAKRLRRQAIKAIGFDGRWGTMVITNDLDKTTEEEVLGWFDRGIEVSRASERAQLNREIREQHSNE